MKPAQQKSIPRAVAGPKAIAIAIRHITRAMQTGKAIKILSRLNQQEGIDCPGCAWPDPASRSKLGEFCENGMKAIAEEATDKLAGNRFFEHYSVAELKTMTDYWLGQQGRLEQPMLRAEGDTHYRPVPWPHAFELIGRHLKALPHPDEAIFYTSGRTSNEAAFLYQLFVRMYGTNNLPDCSNMCHESSGVALKETLGIGKGSVTLEDFDKAELILIFGQNPATNHPRMLTSLEKAKQNGAKIVVVNPLKEVGLVQFRNPQSINGLLGNGSKLADLYLQVKINEDVALLKLVMKQLLSLSATQAEVLDHAFIAQKTTGFADLQRHLQQQNETDLLTRTGLAANDVDTFAQWVAGSKNIIACWAMGLTQHKNAVDNIREVVNLLLLKGSIGRPGAGTCPVRGHSNVQGDRTVGISERPGKALLDKISENFGFKPPQRHGYSVIEAIKAMHEQKAKVFIALGGNFLSAAPDTHYTAAALANCDLTVHISTKLNRSHLETGKTALILPCLGRTDRHLAKGKPQVLSVENSMGVVHSTKGIMNPPSRHLLAEPVIVAEMAKASLPPQLFDWDFYVEDYDRIREVIEKTVPGFENYNQRLQQKNGFELPNGPREGIFTTPDQKAHFTLNELADNPLQPGEYLMMTVRSHDQFNTTVYGLNDRYRGIYNGRKVVFMNATDMAEAGIAANQLVTIYNEYGGIRRQVSGFMVVPYNIPATCVATYFPEANPLIPLQEFAHTSLTPASKSVKVRMEPA